MNKAKKNVERRVKLCYNPHFSLLCQDLPVALQAEYPILKAICLRIRKSADHPMMLFYLTSNHSNVHCLPLSSRVSLFVPSSICFYSSSPFLFIPFSINCSKIGLLILFANWHYYGMAASKVITAMLL